MSILVDELKAPNVSEDLCGDLYGHLYNSMKSLRKDMEDDIAADIFNHARTVNSNFIQVKGDNNSSVSSFVTTTPVSKGDILYLNDDGTVCTHNDVVNDIREYASRATSSQSESPQEQKSENMGDWVLKLKYSLREDLK
jgi:hypothetical protein